MKIAIVLNGISRGKKKLYLEILPKLKEVGVVDVFETKSQEDAITHATRCGADAYDYLFAAGGDGTIHQVVNGLLNNFNGTKLPVLGIIPLGGGNDFARMMRFSADPAAIASAIKRGRTMEVDVGEVEFTPLGLTAGHDKWRRYFINVVDVGMGPEVVKRVATMPRSFGSAVNYYRAILKTFFVYRPTPLEAKSDAWLWHKPVRTFAVANGRYYGNGLCIAPDANPNDGLLNVFACGNVSVLDFILKSIPLKQGKRIIDPEISYMTAKTVSMSDKGGLLIEADGEVLGQLPATVWLGGVKLRMLQTGID